MYKDYYNLQSDPFNTHPNADTFFISETHKEAWYYLLFGIDTQEPFLLLTGEFGMGKTLLCLRLIKLLKEKGISRVEYIPTSNEGYGGILRRMASSLGISTTPEDEEILQDMIYDRFRADTDHSRFYLIVDDAHELDTTILTKLKYLSNFNHNGFFPVVMIFVGHQSFLQDLRTPALSSLNQRIKRRYHLAKLCFEDTKDYIYFRLIKSGAAGIPSFSDETIQKIFEYSGGVPRLINNICDTCLLISASKQMISIPPSIVDEAKYLVEGSLAEAKPEGRADAEGKGNAPTPITFSADLPADTAAHRFPVFSTTDADPQNEHRSPIVFSADLPGGHAVQPSPIFSTITATPLDEPQTQTSFSANLPGASAVRRVPIFTTPEGDDYHAEKTRLRVPMSGRIIRKFVTLAVLVVLLVLAFSWLYDYAMNDNLIKTFLSPATLEPPQNPPVPPVNSAEGISTLREEMTDKSSGQLPAPAARSESMPTPQSEGIPKQGGGAETKQPSKTEPDSAGAQGPFPFYPFSLRSSNYQQQERAFPEMTKLKQIGLNPYLVKTNLGDLGTWWRIYIGHYSTEQEAKKVKTAHNLTNATVHETAYACQVAEFSNEADGINLLEKLKKSGYYPYAIQKGNNLFRMYLGAYENRSEAEAMQRELQEKGIRNHVVKR